MITQTPNLPTCSDDQGWSYNTGSSYDKGGYSAAFHHRSSAGRGPKPAVGVLRGHVAVRLVMLEQQRFDQLPEVPRGSNTLVRVNQRLLLIAYPSPNMTPGFIVGRDSKTRRGGSTQGL